MSITDILQSHGYALIDRVAVEELPNDLPCIPIIPHGLDKDAHLLPVLLPMDEMDETRMAQMFSPENYATSVDQPPLCVTFLASAADPERLRAHLAARLIIRIGMRDRALLRYHDPRVFLQLHWMLDTAQRAALFGPVSQWSIFLDGKWLSFEPPPEADARWVFGTRQVEQLDTIGPINQTLARCALADSDHIMLGKKIHDYLERARLIYRLDDQDRIDFALHALTVHPDFDRHPRIRSLFAEMQREQQSYADASALLQVGEWQLIREEMRQTRKQP